VPPLSNRSATPRSGVCSAAISTTRARSQPVPPPWFLSPACERPVRQPRAPSSPGNPTFVDAAAPRNVIFPKSDAYTRAPPAALSASSFCAKMTRCPLIHAFFFWVEGLPPPAARVQLPLSFFSPSLGPFPAAARPAEPGAPGLPRPGPARPGKKIPRSRPVYRVVALDAWRPPKYCGPFFSAGYRIS